MNLKGKENISIKMNNFILVPIKMQGYDINSKSLKTRFNMAAFSLKVSCRVILPKKWTLWESVIRSFEKGKNFRLKPIDHFSQSLISY